MSAEPSKVVELGPHENMSPDEAIASASRVDWQDVIVVGFTKEGEDLSVRSSHMTRQTALWIAEHLRLYALGRL